MSTEPKPSVGRIVHYHQLAGPAEESYLGPFAAIVTAVDDYYVALTIFEPGRQPTLHGGIPYFSSTERQVHYWTWPPRV